MASYEDIRAFFDDSESLRNAVRSAAQYPLVSGFTLNLDPSWVHDYDVQHELVADMHPAAPEPPWPGVTPAIGYRRRDLRWPKNGWGYVTLSNGRKVERLPVILTVVHRPLRAAKEGEPIETDDTSQLQSLVRAMREFPLFVRIEERPPARLALASGDEIVTSASNSGTLGGVLDDGTGTEYGVTCAHVAQKRDLIDDTTGSRVGTCIDHTALVALSATQVCDPVNLTAPNPSPGNGPDQNMLDCALIKLSTAVARSSIGGVASSLSPGQRVVVAGAVTGTTPHALGSLCLSYAFSSGGTDYCFRDAIELIPQPSGVWGRLVVPNHGDSGAWVLTANQPAEWAGMVFGQDGSRGFAVRAKWVHDWAEKIARTTLAP